MKRLCTAAVCAALMAAGCGNSDTGADAPERRASGAATAASTTASPFLANIDADTAFVYANLERLPAAVVDKAWAMSNASAQSNQAIFDALAEDEDIAAETGALLEELGTLLTREGWEAAGLHANPLYAIYGVDLMPFAELELSNGAAFSELIARVDSKLEQPLKRRDVNGVEVIWAGIEAGFGIAMRHDQDSVTLALIPDDAAMLARVAGQFEPADPMSSDALAAFNRESGFSNHGSGYIDWRRMVNDLMTGESVIGQLSQDNEAYTAVVDNPACVTEYQAVTQALPRMIAGYTRLTENNADFMARQETSASLGAELAPIARSPVSIDRELSGLFNIGLAIDLVAARKFARGLVDGWVTNPPQCPSFEDLVAFAPQMQEALNRPIPPVVTNLQGVFLEADSFSFADGMPTGGGTLSFFMRNPQLLVGMAQMFSPAAAELQLKPGGEPQPVPEGAIPQLQQANLDAWLAMGENAIGIAIGEENVGALSRAVEATEADDLLLTGRFDFRMLVELIGMAESALADIEGDDVAMGLDAQREQYEAMAEVYDRVAFKIGFSDKGIDMIAETTLK